MLTLLYSFLPWKWLFYPYVLAVEFVPGVTVWSRHHGAVVVLSECRRGAVLQEHHVLLVAALDAGHSDVGGYRGVVCRGPLLYSEPEVGNSSASTDDLNRKTYRNSFASPALALIPCVAVNLWPGTLIIGMWGSTCGENIMRWQKCIVSQRLPASPHLCCFAKSPGEIV